MIKLTQQQLAILASANTQPDGFVIRPTTLKPSASVKLVAKLLEQGLVRELLAKGDAPVWREDEHGRAYSVKVLKAGWWRPLHRQHKTRARTSSASRHRPAPSRAVFCLDEMAPQRIRAEPSGR